MSPAPAGRVRSQLPPPSLRLARALLRARGLHAVAGVDEVGRGALAGPVSVGVVAVRSDTATAPRGVHDSKRLSPAERERLEPLLQQWAPAWAVGHASNEEIDAWGILAALRVAGYRALQSLTLAVDHVVLDGSYDWVTRPPMPRFPVGSADLPEPTTTTVQLVVKADQRCAAVAAASVLAKVARDRIMIEYGEADPRFGWAGNKGYAAPDHSAALRRHGPTALHRRSWNLSCGRQLPGQDVLVLGVDDRLDQVAS